MLASWTKHDTATSGTGTITLGSAVAGHTTIGDHFADGELVWYSIEDGNNRENGIGLYTVSGTTLTRTFVKETLVSGTYDRTTPTAISLSGSATVSVSALPESWGWPGLTPGAGHFLRPYMQDGLEALSTGIVAAADRIYLVPVWVPVAQQYDGIRLDIITGSVGDYRAGVASMGADMQALSFLAESASIDSNVTGKQTATFTAIHLNVGFYFMVFLSDATPTVRSFDRRHMGGGHMAGFASGDFRADPGFQESSIVGAPVFPANTTGAAPGSTAPWLSLEAV